MNQVQRFVVSGRVQGVGFRAATRDTARRLGLTGWVRNRSDGTVETLAAGRDSALTDFHTWLQQGPASASVDDVERRDSAETSLPDPFAVR